MEEIGLVGMTGIVKVMILSAVFDVRTMVAGTDGAVTQGTGLFGIGRTGFRTVFTRFAALFKIRADDRGIKAVA